VYDQTKADHAVNFINCLKHTKGQWRGVPFELLPWQDKIIRDIFGTVKENGYRQYNTAYVEIPKKQKGRQRRKKKMQKLCWNSITDITMRKVSGRRQK